MLVAGAVLIIVASVFMSLLESVQEGVARQDYRSRSNDQARLAMEAVDREVRSGSVLYDPAGEVDAGGAPLAYYGLRVYTYANAPTRNAGNPVCVQFRISNQQLLRRWWPSGNLAASTGWQIVATNVVNVTQGVRAFQLDPTNSRIVDVTILANVQTTGRFAGPAVRIQSSDSIRNSGTGNPCTPVPSG
jgi:hypothetical protein